MVKQVLVFCAAVVSASAWAEQPINESRPLTADGHVRVSNVAGAIHVTGWPHDEVQITGELGDGVEGLTVEGDRKSLSVLVRVPEKSRNVDDSTLILKVPVGASLDLEGVSADIIVDAVSGRVAATTVSGDVHLTVASKQIAARTVSGDVTVSAPSASTKLNTVSGDINASGLSGQLMLETVSGDAQIDGAAPFNDLQLKSISGDLNIDAAFTADARVVGETLSGDLQVRTPAPVSAALTVNTFSGSFYNRVVGTTAGKPKGKREIKIGDGKARIDLSSFSGDVTLDSE